MQLTSPPPGKRTLMMLAIALVGLVAVCGLGFAALSITQDLAEPTSWVYGDGDLAVLISWHERDGLMTGTYVMSYYHISHSLPALVSQTIGISGTHDGSHITCTLSAPDVSGTVTGTISQKTLVVQAPGTSGLLQSLTFHPGYQQDYTNAVNAIKQKHPNLYGG